MIFFIRNVLFLHILLLVLAFSWIHGGTRPDLLLPVIPWLTFFMLEFLLVFPQAKSTETLSEARRRVWRSLVRDPLLYLFVALTVLLVFPFFNVAGEPEFNVITDEWRIPQPPMPRLPFCVDMYEHAVLLLWFIPALLAALSAKHGLLKKGKRLLLECFCWNGAVLALFGFIQLMTGAKSVYWGDEKFSYFFSTFGYPNFAGAFFTLLFAISVGLWFGGASAGFIGPSMSGSVLTNEVSQKKAHWMLFPMAMNFTAAIASLSRAAILLCVLIFLVLVAYMFVGVWQKVMTSGRVKLITAVIMMLVLGGLCFTVFAPDSLRAELTTITSDAVTERVSGRGQYHARVAKDIFQAYPVFGVGGWGYQHYVLTYLTADERKRMQIDGGANVHNDTLQFLAEQGAVGFGFLVLCMLSLVVPLLWQSVKINRALAQTERGAAFSKPAFLYRLPPEAVTVFVGTVATIGHSLGDLPFRAPAVLVVWVLAFVCAKGYFPIVRVR